VNVGTDAAASHASGAPAVAAATTTSRLAGNHGAVRPGATRSPRWARTQAPSPRPRTALDSAIAVPWVLPMYA
jgi:hypothetical protein